MAEELKELRNKLEILVDALSTLEDVENNYKETNGINLKLTKTTSELTGSVSELIDTEKKSIETVNKNYNIIIDSFDKIDKKTSELTVSVSELIDTEKKSIETVNKNYNIIIDFIDKIDRKISESHSLINKKMKIITAVCIVSLLASIIGIIIHLINF